MTEASDENTFQKLASYFSNFKLSMEDIRLQTTRIAPDIIHFWHNKFQLHRLRSDMISRYGDAARTQQRLYFIETSEYGYSSITSI